MNTEDILKIVDHTALKPFTTWEEIQKLCEEAIKYNTASVCVPASYVKRISETYGKSVNICTVIGFPLGYNSTESKIKEAQVSLRDGCNEIDMVINITDVKNKDYEKVLEEIRSVKKVCQNHILKVIIETCYLTEEEKIKMCEIVTKSGADFIKTSTGFGTGGATKEDIILFKEHVGKNVKIKAAGGISSLEDLKVFAELGCDRIGTSRAIGLIESSRK